MPLSSDKQFRALWPGNTNAQAPDGAGNVAVTLGGYSLTNVSNAAHTVKFYDKATTPTIGTDAPKRSVTVAAASTSVMSFPRGILFVNGMWVSVTVNAADGDTNAISANMAMVTVDYQT